MIVTEELFGHCPEGHDVIGVRVSSVRVNLTGIRNIGKGPDLVMMANCPHLCGGTPIITSVQLDADSARKVQERRTAIRASRKTQDR